MDQATYRENIYFETFSFPACSVLDWHTVDVFTQLLSLYNLFKLVKKGQHIVIKTHDLHKFCLVKNIMRVNFALNFYSGEAFRSELKYFTHCRNLLNTCNYHSYHPWLL